jgi:hypothetical protein
MPSDLHEYAGYIHPAQEKANESPTFEEYLIESSILSAFFEPAIFDQPHKNLCLQVAFVSQACFI